VKRKIITIENGMVSVPVSANIWMSQYEIARMFECFVAKVSCNVRAILKTGVLDERKICRFYYYGNGGSVEQYSLEMITALSFRIKSHNAEVFRDWLMRKAVTNVDNVTISLFDNWDKIQLN
jgi:hypothetical protein